MADYLFWVLFAVLGLVSGWMIWGRSSVVQATKVQSIAQPTQPTNVAERIGSGWTSSGPAPFRVVTLDGDVIYEGASGASARRSIESLRTGDVEWRSYRSGEAWDWGPRT